MRVTVTFCLLLTACGNTPGQNASIVASDNSTANLINRSQNAIDQAASDMDNGGIPHADYKGYKACLENAYGNEAWEACDEQYSDK